MLDNLYVGVQGSGRPLWFWIASPAQSLHQPITHSCSLSLLIGFVSLFAGFKDKEILIELLCNFTSQCITRQLDINHPPSSVLAVIFFFFLLLYLCGDPLCVCPPFIYHNTLLKQHIRCVLVWHLTLAKFARFFCIQMPKWLLVWVFQHVNETYGLCASFLTDSGPAKDAHSGFKSLDGFASSYLSDLLGLDTTEWPLNKHCRCSKDLKLCCFNS